MNGSTFPAEDQNRTFLGLTRGVRFSLSQNSYWPEAHFPASFQGGLDMRIRSLVFP